MGRYFGLINLTKKQKVSSYWKSDSYCDCHSVMHQLRWDTNDIIMSACYDTTCKIMYDEKENIMVVEDYENSENNYLLKF